MKSLIVMGLTEKVASLVYNTTPILLVMKC